MKKLAFLSLLATPAFAHKIQPETQFFKDKIKEDPEVIQLLQYCHLRGFANEETCKNNFYDSSGAVSKHLIKSAATCLKKSGWEYRASLDNFFGIKEHSNDGLSHKIDESWWHTFYAKDPEKPNSKSHRHDWSEDLRQAAGEKTGVEAVANFKAKMQKDGLSFTTGDSATTGITLGGGVVPGSASGTHTGSTSTTTTKSTYSQKEIDQAYESGYKRGQANPLLAGYDPDISCEEKGPCYSNQAGGAYENPDYTKKEVVKEEGKKPVEAPKVEPVKPVETENKDPFAAFPSDDTSTGSIKVEEKKEDKKTEEKKKDDKAVTTTVDNDNFQLEWNDCIYEEQLKLFNEEGEKTIDPEAKSREEKRAEALEELKNGYCDVAILGSDFCSGWQRELDSKKVVEEIDLSYPEKYRIAVTRLEMFGECDREVLSQAYCDKYFTDLSSTPVDDSLEPEIEENEDLPPNTVIPDHISGSGFFDGADGNPSEGTPKTEE